MHRLSGCLAAGLASRSGRRMPPEDVDLTLVLVTDVSRSIDDSEFKLEKDGYAAAFTVESGG